MMGKSKKFTAATVVAVLAVAAVPAVVVASVITNATGVAVTVTAKLKPTSSVVFSGSTGPLAGIVSTCKASTTKFTLSSKGGGLGPFTLTNPTYTTCTDNANGTDTIKTNSTNGAWTATYVNAASATKPDMLKLVVPKAGETITSSAASGCLITVAPTAAGAISGTYDNAGNLDFTNQPLKYSLTGSSCLLGTGSGNATLSTTLNSGATGSPGYAVTPPIFGIH